MQAKITSISNTTRSDIAACISLQKQSWGNSIIPASVLTVLPKIGGLLAIAKVDDVIRGVLIGMLGHLDGESIQWSCRLVVDHSYQNHHLGLLLKQYQQDWCRHQQIPYIYWSFDPLVTKNAYFNCHKLGARFTKFIPDMYPEPDSDLSQGTANTDRLLVQWSSNATAPSKSELAALTEAFKAIQTLDRSTPIPKQFDGSFKLALPDTILEIRHDTQSFSALRQVSSEVFKRAFDQGYQIRHFYREHPYCYYVFTMSELSQ